MKGKTRPRQKTRPDRRYSPVKSIAEARQRIDRAFVENDWTPEQRATYVGMAVGIRKPLTDCDPDEIRTIYRRMLISRMVLEEQ